MWRLEKGINLDDHYKKKTNSKLEEFSEMDNVYAMSVQGVCDQCFSTLSFLLSSSDYQEEFIFIVSMRRIIFIFKASEKCTLRYLYNSVLIIIVIIIMIIISLSTVFNRWGRVGI